MRVLFLKRLFCREIKIRGRVVPEFLFLQEDSVLSDNQRMRDKNDSSSGYVQLFTIPLLRRELQR